MRAWDESKIMAEVKKDDKLTGQERRYIEGDFPPKFPVILTEISGSLCITIKKDILNMPILFFGQFIPSPTALRLQWAQTPDVH